MAPTPGLGAAFKDEGNVHFKAQEFLKAAASYTKAIRAEPDSHVFYEPLAGLLQALKGEQDARGRGGYISLNPSFVKGYHRKASALHAGEPHRRPVAQVLLAGD